MIQVGAGGIKSLAGSHTVMSMDAILESLVGKARVEAEESQRLLLAALNGIAGLMILQEENAEAVAVYRQALVLGNLTPLLCRIKFPMILCEDSQYLCNECIYAYNRTNCRSKDVILQLLSKRQ